MLYNLVCRITLFFVLVFNLTVLYADTVVQPQGWVTDLAGVINPDYENKIGGLITQLETKTGAEIAVLTVKSIAPYDEKEYARLIFDNWKIGKRGKDNGILILLAVQPRRWRIETGYGLEEILPDGKCGEIGRNYMVPYFKEGNYALGIYYGVTQIVRIIAQDAGVNISEIENIKPSLNAKNTDRPVSIFLPVFALFFFSIWNIPWPIFIGLPFTLLFAFSFYLISKISGVLAVTGYLIALLIRHAIWSKIPLDKRKSFLRALIWGLAGGSGTGNRDYSGGGFGGGGFSGGFGGGGGGGGGSGGGF